MIDIGIIGAMEIEVRELASALKDVREESWSGIKFYIGELFGKQVAVAKCGVGKVFAAICAQTMILKYSPKLLINSGVGGAVAEGLSTGDVVIANRLCQHDMDTSAVGDPVGLVSGINRIWFESDARAVEILLSSAKEQGLSAYVAPVATGDKFIASSELREKIQHDFGASACEMEGCAVAQTAFVNGVPFAVIRAISDSANGEASMDYPTFLDIAAKNSTALTLSLVEKY